MFVVSSPFWHGATRVRYGLLDAAHGQAVGSRTGDNKVPFVVKHWPESQHSANTEGEARGGQSMVSKPNDPMEVVATIRESIEASPRKSRKVLFHNLRGKFGWQVWTVQRRELVAQLLKDQEILAQPPLADAGLDDWIMLSMPIITSPGTKDPISRPDDDFFRRLMSVHLGAGT